MDLSSETWAALWGAAAGTIGSGLISYLLQSAAFKRDEAKKVIEREDHRKAIGLSVLFKTMTITSDFTQFKLSLDECEFPEDETGRVREPWEALQSVSNIPSMVELTIDEISLLMSFDNPRLLNKALNAFRIHKSTIDHLRHYSERRTELHDLLEPLIDEDAGTSIIPADRYQKCRSRMLELNSIYGDLVERADADSKLSEEVLSTLNAELQNRLGFTTKFEKVVHSGPTAKAVG